LNATDPSGIADPGGGAASRSPEPAGGDSRSGGSWSATGQVAKPVYTGWKKLARRTAHWALVTTGRPVYRARMLPSFLIAGFSRCGSTSLHYVIKQHPAVFSPILPRKEVRYFDLQYSQGLAWYQAHFPLIVRARLTTRLSGLAPVAFESTPNYVFHPLAPERIHRDLPDVKLILLVRDPVERAYSAYTHQLGFGFETEPFERALELEDSRLEGEIERTIADPNYSSRTLYHNSYRTRGHYADQLERLEKIFSRDQILVIDSGDFFANPVPFYDRTLDFLGLPRRGQPTFVPRNARPRSAMPDSVRAQLEEHFRPHDERLTAWLGREPSWRR
jgi:hypothetical protein